MRGTTTAAHAYAFFESRRSDDEAENKARRRQEENEEAGEARGTQSVDSAAASGSARPRTRKGKSPQTERREASDAQGEACGEKPSTESARAVIRKAARGRTSTRDS